ncbi:uncharacterized protein LOC122756612 [Drosophila santomea]|uniref:uncharacterized protein LOC122756612 n=1 Tax=Drosophila santomea TaxID=129105 RepID=UPI001CCA1CC3|nr:uncharacterized protein LOC122756612 [Drosophila santomea]
MQLILILALWSMAMVERGRFEITPLEKNDPLAQIEMGTARVVQTYQTYIHIVKLQDFNEIIGGIEKTLGEVEDESGTRDVIRSLKNKLHMLKTRLEGIWPRHRRARGLINGLGSVVKAITGNLDANNAEKLEEEIRKMREEEEKLRESINSQERTGNKVSFIFKNLTKYINEEQSRTDCGVDKALNGSVLIRFTNCKVMVNNVQYEAEEGLSTAKLGLDIPRIETVKRNRTTQELGIHELRMEDLETKVQISRMQWGTTIHATTTYTMLGVLMIVTPHATFTPAIAEPAMITAAMPPLWSVAQTEGGGVTASAFTLGGPPSKPPRQPET